MPSENSSFCAIIPVRAGSKRVPNKNIRSFADTNLLALKIRQLLSVEMLSAIYVSSDSDEMLSLADSIGCIALKRPDEYSNDTVPMSEVYAYLASEVGEDVVVFTHVTNPLCRADAYSAAINTYGTRAPEYDSLTTVSDVKDFLYWDGKTVNFDPKNKPRSQDLPDIVKLNHAISIAPKELMIREKNIFGANPYLMKLTDIQAFDIDTELDFEVAEFLFRRSN